MKYAFSLDRFRIWLAVAVLAIIALGSFWVLEVLRRNDDDGNARSSARSEPDYYVEKFNFIKLSNNGQANFHVAGERLTHHPRYDNFEIQQPRINSFDEEKTPVTIRADKAIVEQKNAQGQTPSLVPKESDEIHLYGNVNMERPDTTTAKFMRLQTDYLLLLPDVSIMKTDKAVTLYSGRSETHAIGMIANNATQEVQLLSKVRMSIDRPNSKRTSTN
ncbi:LPS export ABC transporter periplasmic protein LptC [Undibacterium sp. Jales W-56]|uniref:LPS export ABC transporter periplasmic protein LptC n=1 Tax=Undibacterium sp. Jales W-56 TaxID=2897325 RepID=UPI0021D21257|nr:LPS export ABC transporter periplasmic protein LptC [Undibacterium sp. Jales W-56]MCU6432245.1 LPS export ABC transporter periplasmic protein LptC [Undibacterium sp. Jales W-56]